MGQTKYDVFISYSRKDYVDDQKNVIPGNEVSRIKEALSDAGISYWIDEDGIYSGQDFAEIIATSIESAKILLFLSTANSNNSRWACKEIATADELGKPIIPIRIDNTPYNNKVLFRIADLDFIEYYSNPDMGMNKMINSIKNHLILIENEEKKRSSETYKKQQQLFFSFRLECDTLRKEFERLYLKRENLILTIDNQITDQKQREALKAILPLPNTTTLIGNHLPVKPKELFKQQSLFSILKKDFDNCFDFVGRASRSEYWCWIVLLMIVIIGGYLPLIYFSQTTHTVRWLIGLIIWLIALLVLLIPTISISIRRCHDTNRSGWWILVPFYNIVIMCLPSLGKT